MKPTAGKRLYSTVDTTSVIVVRWGAEDLDLTCDGSAMSETAPAAPGTPPKAGTTQLGKRYVTDDGAVEDIPTSLLLRSIARDDDEQLQRALQMRRDLRAVWIGAIVFWVSWISGPVGATLAFGVFSFLALREFITLAHTRRSDGQFRFVEAGRSNRARVTRSGNWATTSALDIWGVAGGR